MERSVVITKVLSARQRIPISATAPPGLSALCIPSIDLFTKEMIQINKTYESKIEGNKK